MAVSGRYIFLAMMMPNCICIMRLFLVLIPLLLCYRIFCLTIIRCVLPIIVNLRADYLIWRHTSRQNSVNWAGKGAVQLNKLISALKSIALEFGDNVNVDETWYHYQIHLSHRKNLYGAL